MGTIVFQGQSPYTIAALQSAKSFSVGGVVRLNLTVLENGELREIQTEMLKIVALELASALAVAADNTR